MKKIKFKILEEGARIECGVVKIIHLPLLVTILIDHGCRKATAWMQMQTETLHFYMSIKYYNTSH